MEHVDVLPKLPKPAKRVVATSKNTSSVRNGTEVGGYIKEEWFSAAQMREYAIAALSARGEAVAWVNPKDLLNPRFVGINAAKPGHELLGKHYTQPLYAHPQPQGAVVDDAMVRRFQRRYYEVTGRNLETPHVDTALVAAFGEGKS